MLEFTIAAYADNVDELSDQLHLLGAAAVTWKDAGDKPIYEPMPGEIIQWPEMTISALFEENEMLEPINNFLLTQQQKSLLISFDVKEVPAQDWVRASLDQFEPIKFGRRLWICPSWITPPDPVAVNVLLDPGLAFGTGTHPTTAMCLEWLDEHVKGGETLLDYGCGSGILAVAALKLGVKYAVGVDYDPQALEACRLNAELNALTAEQMRVQLPETFNQQTEQFDILIANILAKPLIELSEVFAAYIKPNSHIVLSGILSTQAQDVIEVYQRHYTFISQVQKEEWVRLHFIKN